MGGVSHPPPAESITGYFGKVPTNGDFVSRGLPPSFVEPWDQWLQEVLAESRESLGDGWLEIYLTSPIWRFALARGACGENAWIGILVPSVDAVGRYFPITFASNVPLGASLITSLASARTWFEDMEEMAIKILDSGFRREDVDRVLDAADVRPVLVRAPIKASAVALENSWHGLGSSGEVAATLQGITDQLLESRLGPFSLWWGDGSDRVPPSLLVSPALPSTQRYTAMLDGQWARHGWHVREAEDAL